MSNFKLPSKFSPRNDPPPYSENSYAAVPQALELPDLEKGSYTNIKLEKFPAIVNCTNCNLQVTTNVDKKVTGNGWIWAILCCCFGSWVLSLLVMCMDIFWKFIHYCPRCSNKLAEYSPPASLGLKFLLVILSFGVVVLQFYVVYAFIFPMFFHEM